MRRFPLPFERRVNTVARKKIVFVIVEGPSDDSALGLLFARFYKDKQVYVHILHRDITTEQGMTQSKILAAVVDEVKSYACNTHLTYKHFHEIIHIVDTDGAFVDDSNIIEDITKDHVYYSLTEIRTKDKSGIERRNLQKRENLNKISAKRDIWKIPYNVFYMSCNLDHVLHNKINSTDEEKEKDAFIIAKRYESDLAGFVEFISQSDFSVAGNYAETWAFIKEDKHSLERHTNLGLCFKAERSSYC